MGDRPTDLGRVKAMALCALLALLLFLGFLVLVVSTSGLLAFAGLAAALVCPAIWLAVLRSPRVVPEPIEPAGTRQRPAGRNPLRKEQA